jgi:hypothetical protein
MIIAVVAIVFGCATRSYGQEASTTNESTAPANSQPTETYVDAGKGYKIGGDIVLAHAAGKKGNIHVNISLGVDALAHNSSGFSNTASGYQALFENTSGSFNMASGSYALALNTTGNANTASGAYALLFNTGSENTAIGYQACYGLVTGSNVICIGANAGPAGDIPGPATYIGGIYGAPTAGSGNPLVCIDSTGLLGTTGCASMAHPHEQQEMIEHQQVQIETLQEQNEELQQRVSRLEALTAKK